MELMTRKRRRSRSGKQGQFTEEELEVADILLTLSCLGEAPFPEWGAKRRRSWRIARSRTMNWNTTIHRSRFSPVTPLGASLSEAEDYVSCSKRGRATDPAGRRAAKKKTCSELKEMVNALSVERDWLKENKEEILKTYQKLQAKNKHLKSELVLQLSKRQAPKLTSIMRARLNDSDRGQKTNTSSWHDELPIFEGHGCSKVIADAFTLVPACNEPRSNGRLIYQHACESSSESERNYSKPTKGVFTVSIPDLNASPEGWPDAVRDGYSDNVLLSMNKSAFAAEARKRTIELTRENHFQSHEI